MSCCDPNNLHALRGFFAQAFANNVSLFYVITDLHLARTHARIFVRECSEKRTVFGERSPGKTVSLEEQAMSKDNYKNIFSRQMEAIVFSNLQIPHVV